MAEPQTVLQTLQNLEAVRGDTLQRLQPLSQPQLDWRPGPEADGSEEAWSLGEVFMHLALDEIYLRELIAVPLLMGIKPPEEVRFLPPPPPYGYSKEVILFWFEQARRGTLDLLAGWPEDAPLDLDHQGGLQPMNALEWLEGYASHEAFHHRQMDHLVSILV
ncbi:MAG: DinB family protein [Anaerolineales bacterium]|nr:DinB family protein [Anaerolineales bacterium]